MTETYIIKRTDTGQYYHSIGVRGNPLWTDKEEHAQGLFYGEAYDLVDLLSNTVDKHSLVITEG